MTYRPPGSGPDPEGGPAPGVEFGAPGARLVAYIVDDRHRSSGSGSRMLLVAVILVVIFPPLAILPSSPVVIVPVRVLPVLLAEERARRPGMKLMGVKVVRDSRRWPDQLGRRSCA